MSTTRRGDEVPTAYLVTDRRARPPVRLRLGEVLAPFEDAGRTTVVLFLGLWPLWAALALGMGLVWGSAMASSP